MNRDRSRRRAQWARGAVVACLAGVSLGVGVRLDAQSAADFLPKITIVEIMDSMVMPNAQVVWDAVSYDVTEKGETINGPKTDDDWQRVRRAAITLAESANNLMVPGRAVTHPGTKPGEGELAPEEIAKLIAKERGAWIGHAKVLYEAVMQAVGAIDVRDVDKLSDAGGTIDAACESCHLQFWYPNQR